MHDDLRFAMDEDLWFAVPPRCVADRRNQRSVVTRDVVADLTSAATPVQPGDLYALGYGQRKLVVGSGDLDERLAARGGRQASSAAPTAGSPASSQAKRCQGASSRGR